MSEEREGGLGNLTHHKGGSLSFGGTLANLEERKKALLQKLMIKFEGALVLGKYLFIVNLFGGVFCVFLALIFRAFIACSCSFFFCAALFA